jgi:hypothetical protein
LKTERERMNIISAFNEAGTFRGAAAMCGCDPKTVKRALGHPVVETSRKRAEREHNYDLVRELVAKKVASTGARITAKRLLPEAKAAGYGGSARNLRRLVAKAKRDWRAGNHRGRASASVGAGRVPGDRLGQGGPAAHLLRCAGL